MGDLKYIVDAYYNIRSVFCGAGKFVEELVHFTKGCVILVERCRASRCTVKLMPLLQGVANTVLIARYTRCYWDAYPEIERNHVIE